MEDKNILHSSVRVTMSQCSPNLLTA